MLYYNWNHDGSIVWLSWIDENLLLGNKNGVLVHHKKMVEKLDEFKIP